ncbi:MAG TPA: TIGR04255 family protein [Candidatus Hodarchaeales archaeon]|nr:TIGR04255 family protein [Candidatus Hodarchaeales archaeon]
MPLNPIYPNAPLVEVVFEIRFPGEPAIECHRDQFFQLIRSEYKNVWVPNLREGQAPALTPYHFKSDDGLCTVMTAINRLAFSTKKYQGFENFKREVLRLMGLFTDSYEIGKLSRTGLRYINVIRYVPQDQKLPLSDYLNLELKLPDVFPGEFKKLDLAFVSIVKGGSITTRLGHMEAKDGSGDAILLDFDFAKEGNLDVKEISSYLDESHTSTKAFFESVLSEGYLRFVKGETI